MEKLSYTRAITPHTKISAVLRVIFPTYIHMGGYCLAASHFSHLQVYVGLLPDCWTKSPQTFENNFICGIIVLQQGNNPT